MEKNWKGFLLFGTKTRNLHLHTRPQMHECRGLGVRERESVCVCARGCAHVRADKGESASVEVWIERGGRKGMT